MHKLLDLLPSPIVMKLAKTLLVGLSTLAHSRIGIRTPGNLPNIALGPDKGMPMHTSWQAESRISNLREQRVIGSMQLAGH